MMKTTMLATAGVLAVLVSGCVTRVVYTPTPPPPSAPPPTTTPPAAPGGAQAPVPAPPPAAPAGYVPDYYTWDGYEYVGVYGDQYVYWTGAAWIICDPVIIGRFHGWERYHPGWRGRAFYYHRHDHDHWH